MRAVNWTWYIVLSPSKKNPIYLRLVNFVVSGVMEYVPGRRSRVNFVEIFLDIVVGVVSEVIFNCTEVSLLFVADRKTGFIIVIDASLKYPERLLNCPNNANPSPCMKKPALISTVFTDKFISISLIGFVSDVSKASPTTEYRRLPFTVKSLACSDVV